MNVSTYALALDDNHPPSRTYVGWFAWLSHPHIVLYIRDGFILEAGSVYGWWIAGTGIANEQEGEVRPSSLEQPAPDGA